MSTTSITHRPAPLAIITAVAVALAACALALSLSGSLSLPGSGSHQPTLRQFPSYSVYPPGGQHQQVFHPTTAGGRTMIGE